MTFYLEHNSGILLRYKIGNLVIWDKMELKEMMLSEISQNEIEHFTYVWILEKHKQSTQP